MQQGLGRFLGRARFEGFELDLRTGELRRNGSKAVRLGEQPLQILVMLLERPGEVVSRDEIRQRLWPNDTIVEFEHSSSAAMNRLRQVLGDSAATPSFVETLAGRGYRWMVPVEWIEPAPAPALVPTPAGASLQPRDAETSAPERAGHFTHSNPIGCTVSHYRILERLGGGGMGVVYKAEDVRLGRKVALKFLPSGLSGNPVALARFQREARAASALNHPHICTVYEIEEQDGQPFIAMELMEGQTLAPLIAGRPLPLNRILDLGVQIADALEAAHAKGIIHRDIKPANIFVTQRGEAKILDFGLAKLTGGRAIGSEGEPQGADEQPLRDNSQTSSHDGNLSLPGAAMGTAAYMSPEQTRGEEVDARTDLFSLGAVLYEIATGRQAFEGATVALLREAILQQLPSPIRQWNGGLPLELERIVGKALEKDRDLRYQHAADIRIDLKCLKRDTDSGRSASAAVGAPAPPPAARPAVRWARRAAAIAVMGIVGIAVAWIIWDRYGRMPEQTLRQLTTNSSENPVTAAAISPDGKYLAYADETGIYLRLVETGEVHPISTPQGATMFALSWFPDGTTLLASGGAGESGAPSIWAISILGGSPRKLRDDAGAASPSPDGSRIAFTSAIGPAGNGKEIWVMSADGEEPRKVVASAENDRFARASWFPDGQRLLYGRVRFDEKGFYVSIESHSFKDGRPNVILSDPRITGGCLLPEGRVIYSLREPSPHDSEANFWEIGVNLRTGQAVGKPRRLTSWSGFYLSGLFSATANGKRLTLLKRTPQADVFVGELGKDPSQLKDVQRLTLDDRNDLPSGWTPDSKAVRFSSDRNGHFDIFRQAVGQCTAEVLVAGPGFKGGNVTPDGEWILYSHIADGEPGYMSLMRAPITGGPAQSLLRKQGFVFSFCARSPMNQCVVAEDDRKQVIFSRLDPVQGKGRELARVTYDPLGGFEWDLSSDGSRVALLRRQPHGPIRIISLRGEQERDIPVSWRGTLQTMNWSADGQGWYVGSESGRVSDLLFVDSNGHAQVLRHQAGPFGIEAIPSPDGRRLAFTEWTSANNVWMIENF